MRSKVGSRRYNATFQVHNGTLDAAGTPTYTTESDWQPIVAGWPCEMKRASAGEVLRGSQVVAETTHVLFGEYFGATSVVPEARCVVDGQLFNITSVQDPDGFREEMRIELRRES